MVNIPRGMEEFIPPYLQRRREELRTLSTLLGNGDFSSIRRICHDLKGTGASYRFQTITDVGARMETAAKNEDTVRLSAGLQELSHYLESVQFLSQ
jgi:HPt (histidine-containing phosphotransfer) domain-containing protein